VARSAPVVITSTRPLNVLRMSGSYPMSRMASPRTGAPQSARLTALMTAFSDAVTMLASMPTPQ
jgi:hypothetical protein